VNATLAPLRASDGPAGFDSSASLTNGAGSGSPGAWGVVVRAGSIVVTVA
jgi:hypothetical protein